MAQYAIDRFIDNMPKLLQKMKILTPDAIRRLQQIKGEYTDSFKDALKFLFLKPLKYFEPVEYISHLQKEKPLEILEKFLLFIYLRNYCTPLQSLKELATQTEQFIGFLKDNKQQLIKFGYTDPILCPVLEIFKPFSNLYPTDFQKSKYISMQYDISEANLKRLEEDRSKILNLEIDIHKILCEAVKRKKTDNLWLQCVSKLEKFSPADIGFYIRMECDLEEVTSYHGARNLMTIFDNIGRYEKELRIHTSAIMQDSLGVLDVFKQSNDRQRIIEHYAVMFGDPDRSILDSALKELSNLLTAEKIFWKGHRDRVNKLLFKKSEEVSIQLSRIEGEALPYKLDVLDFIDWAEQLFKPGRILPTIAQEIISGARLELEDIQPKFDEPPEIELKSELPASSIQEKLPVHQIGQNKKIHPKDSYSIEFLPLKNCKKGRKFAREYPYGSILIANLKRGLYKGSSASLVFRKQVFGFLVFLFYIKTIGERKTKTTIAYDEIIQFLYERNLYRGNIEKQKERYEQLNKNKDKKKDLCCNLICEVKTQLKDRKFSKDFLNEFIENHSSKFFIYANFNGTVEPEPKSDNTNAIVTSLLTIN